LCSPDFPFPEQPGGDGSYFLQRKIRLIEDTFGKLKALAEARAGDRSGG